MSMSILAPSTLSAQRTQRDTVLKLQTEFTTSAEEVSTGRHADPYAALGRKSASVLGLESDLARTENLISSNTLLDNRMAATGDALGHMREIAEEVLTLAMPNSPTRGPTVSSLAEAARSAFDRIVAMANTSYEGRSLFGGVATDRKPVVAWAEVSPNGTAPSGMVATATGGALGPAADATAKADALDALFAETSTAQPGYMNAVYDGAPANGPRLAASVDEGQTLQYGVQADDPAFRDLFQGLSMLAGVDPATIADPAAYSEWMTRATEKLSSAVTGLLSAESEMGVDRARLEVTVEKQQSRRTLYMQQIHDLSGVDPYEAASRMTEIESRLQVSYAVTSRMIRLSFLDYM
ncbi:hypothetical protein LVO79_20120 (plasmid) [Roseivivax marinus]|jgi:flagellar hook-associated protein 3 FlgL|uniref:flagellin N-terminal helical domain-containing protein n=2 Tax=Roseivivax marinus TaxID=1379903 RepID=UPI001F0390E0|nr:flagellin [Roseivivax marinus]UMA66873.1 hypothetical protein LVO79_20120 [Roseivivax marinus]